jgi:GT2 family glycosyltransferase
MAKIAIVTVPYLKSTDHFYFAEGTINSLVANRTSHTLDLIAIVNANECGLEATTWLRKTFHYIEENDENCVARGWNKGLDRGFNRGADYCLVINLDLLFHPLYLENLLSFAESNRGAIMWSGELWTEEATLSSAPLSGEIAQGCHASAFLVDRRLTELVGPFDEGFKPAYFEDIDMFYRMKLAGCSGLRSASARFLHYENITIQSALIKKEILFVRDLRRAVDANEQRYTQKWGGPQGAERFTTPFNEPDSKTKA